MKTSLSATLTAGLLISAAGQAVATPAPPPAKAGPAAVVALIDTGINPYHLTFRDGSPRSFAHPSTYIPGYPKDAIALRITLTKGDERRRDDYWEAVRADCQRVWSTVKPGKLYWFPGTKIIGAISFDEPAQLNCMAANPVVPGILDYGAHGTMVASRAASVEYGACHECLIVSVQGFSNESVGWAADNSGWIDAQSNSWGPFLPLWEPGQGEPGFTSNAGFVRTVERAAKRHLSFWASGNGALTRFGAIGHPTIIDPRMTPSIVMVGGHDSGYINTWPDFPPHVIADSCNSWAAYADEVDESAEDVGGGTSGASPWAAGGAARILLEARRILGDTDTGVTKGVAARGRPGIVDDGPLADGELTLAEWKELTFKTASPRPKGQFEDGSVCDLVGGLVIYGSTPVRWQDVPEGYPEYLHIGYGAVDAESLPLAFKVLRGAADMPDRSATDEYFGYDRMVRERLHDIYDGS